MPQPPGHDPSDLPEPASLIPSLPGGGGTPLPAPVRDPGDVDSALPVTPGPAPERVAPPPPEDPVALARRLAEEAKKKAAAAAPSEDPVALARRLAEEAKKKAAAAAPKPAAKPPPASPPPPAAAARPGRAKTAAEMLAESREAEAREAAAREEASRKAAKPVEASPKAPAPPAVSRPDPAVQLAGLLRGATVERTFPVHQEVAFKAVWQAHLARAQATEDIALATTASALVGAIERIGAANLITAEVRWGGQVHAVWLDQRQGTLVATAFPAHVYLAGST